MDGIIETKETREIRWADRLMDHIPVLIMVGGMVIGSIAWFIRIESRVNYMFERTEKYTATGDARSRERNETDEAMRTRITKLEVELDWIKRAVSSLPKH